MSLSEAGASLSPPLTPPLSPPSASARPAAPHSDVSADVGVLAQDYELQLLRRLGLARRPKPPPAFNEDGAPAVSNHMHRLYRRFEEDDDWQDFLWRVGEKRKQLGRLVAVRSHRLIPDRSPFWRPHNSSLRFDLSSLVTSFEERPVAGELRLFLNLTGRPGRRRVEVLELQSRPGRAPRQHRLHARILPVPSAGWRHFDVSPALVRWARKRRWRRSGEGSLVVRVTSPPRRLRRSVGASESPGGFEWRRSDSELFSYYQNPQKRRRKRKRKRNRHRKSGRRKKRRRRPAAAFGPGGGRHDKRNALLQPNRARRCQRRPLYVDFHDVGWNEWIVAPPGYHARLCDGECSQFPLSDPYNTTNHAIIQYLVYSKQPDHVPPPCCVAISLSSKAILLFDEYRNVLLKTYDEMVVDSCGCR